MGVAHENRVKMMYHREAQERIAHAIEMEALRRGLSNRAPIPAQPPNPSKAEVRRWMRLHAEEYEGATALAEGCNAALDLLQSWLDDPDHWVWDLAAEEAQRAAREYVKGVGA